MIFVTEVIGATPSSQQVELLQSINSERRVTVRSGHGTGKDACAAWVILWFSFTRPYAKVVCTAPTARQLSDILWSEISKWIRKSTVLREELVVQKDKIFNRESSKEWWIRAVSASVKATKEEQAETLAGFHGEHLLLVVDESSGVPDPVYIPVEGAMTQEDNKLLLIGNMTKDKGYFYDSHFHTEIKKAWKRLHWNSEDSTNVDKSYPLYMAAKYGKESNVYRIRVKGDPPLSDETTLIPLAWAQQCIGNEISVSEEDPLYLGVDVARHGDDSSVILPRKGLRIDPWEEFQGMDTVWVAGQVSQVYQELEADGVAIDEIGIGAGVYDTLFRKNLPGLQGVNVANSSSDQLQWHRLRDELWLAVRDKCMRSQYSFPVAKLPGEQETFGDQIANELSSLTYDFDANGAFLVESKKAAKLRGVVSPNVADALCLTEYFHNVATRVWNKKKPRKRPHLGQQSRAFRSRVTKRSQLWMAA